MKSSHSRNCAICGEPFNYEYRGPDKKPHIYCSPKCYQVARWGEPIMVTCPVCAVVFKPRDRSRKFCGWACAQADKVGRPNPGRSNRETRPCEWCGEDVNRPVSNFHSGRTFCNARCAAEWQSEFNVGEAHPRWRGGQPYGTSTGWKAARRTVMDRCGGTCERCNKRPARDVHHLLPVRYFRQAEDAHFVGNLIAVCRVCHAAEHRKLAKSLPLLDMAWAHRGKFGLSG